MRLTQKMRYEIVERITKTKFTELRKELTAEIKSEVTLQIAEACKDLPIDKCKDFLHFSSKYNINCHAVKPYTHYWGDLVSKYPVRSKGESASTHSPRITPKLRRLLKKYYKIQADNYTFRDDLTKLVFAVSSTEELYKILPEAEKFVDKELVGRLRKNLK